MDVELYDCVVTHYGYRQAEVVNRIAKFDFNTGDHIDQLRDVLAYEADVATITTKYSSPQSRMAAKSASSSRTGSATSAPTFA